ncbi:MAG TPA: biotin/lipoyl-binding protein, partial [Caulobacteraceae bacterium]
MTLLRKPTFWLGVLAVIVVMVGGLTMSRMNAQKARAEAVAKSHPLNTPYAAIASGKADVEGGVIQVAARTAGIVRQVFVQEGDTVRKGQVLARLEDDQPRLAAQTAAAGLAQARAQVDTIDVQMQAAQRE